MGAQRKRQVDLKDMLRTKLVNDAQVTADGRTVAFVVADNHKVDPEGVVRSAIWLSELDEERKLIQGSSRRFTGGARNDLLPRWSPDGETLAFFSNRAGGTAFQLYTMKRRGGEASQLTNLPGRIGPAAFGVLPNPLVWSRDGREIAFLMQDEESAEDAERDKKAGGVLRFEASPRFLRIWIVDVRSGKARPASPAALHVWEFDWSQDGGAFAAIVSDEPYEWSWYRAKLVTISAKSGRTNVIYDPRPRQIARPLWSPDGSSIYFLTSVWSDRGIVAGDLMVVPSRRRVSRATDLTKGYRGSISWMEWSSKDELIFTSDESGEAVIGTLKVDPWRKRPVVMTPMWRGKVALAPGYWQRFSLSPSTGTLVAGMESYKVPPEAWVGKIQQDRSTIQWSQLSEVNRHLGDLLFGEMKELEWRSSDGLTVKGFLALPPEGAAKRSRKLPLVVIVHGGPTLSFKQSFHMQSYAYPMHLLAAKGFAVLMPNIRGSTGRGLRYAEANVGDMGGGDLQDVLSGVDRCLETGLIDPKRLYLTGHSYGGFMTAWAVTQTKRFRAAMMSAGVSDWVSYHGTAEIPMWDTNHYRSEPYPPDSPQRRFSAINYIKNAKTPTRIVVGGEDPSAPPSQSYQFFRALKEMGVETELSVYPREGHGFKEASHMLDTVERLLDWFNKH